MRSIEPLPVVAQPTGSLSRQTLPGFTYGFYGFSKMECRTLLFIRMIDIL